MDLVRYVFARIVVYLRVLKPRETILLGLIGVCAALVAGDGTPPMGRFILAAIVIVVGSGGSNGITNYLDRHVDARSERTRRRVLPSGLLAPRNALVWSASLVFVSLILAFFLHPYAFLAGCLGITAAVTGRKTWFTHFMGSISSCGPILVGWFAVNPNADTTLIALAILILIWVPVHVWNLMLAYRSDYIKAGVNIFPLTRGLNLTYRLSLALTIALYIDSLFLWWVGGFGWLYFVIANIVGLWMLYSVGKLTFGGHQRDAFRTFKFSAYPFLGFTFVGLVIDIWLRLLLA